jgi:hypothetical protein
MSRRIAAFALVAMLGSTSLAHAQQAPTPEPPKITVESGGVYSIPLREVAAIGTGVIVGAALWHVVIGHGFVLAGAVLGGWVGDWFYSSHPVPQRSGG